MPRRSGQAIDRDMTVSLGVETGSVEACPAVLQLQAGASAQLVELVRMEVPNCPWPLSDASGCVGVGVYSPHGLARRVPSGRSDNQAADAVGAFCLAVRNPCWFGTGDKSLDDEAPVRCQVSRHLLRTPLLVELGEEVEECVERDERHGKSPGKG